MHILPAQKKPPQPVKEDIVVQREADKFEDPYADEEQYDKNEDKDKKDQKKDIDSKGVVDSRDQRKSAFKKDRE